MDSVRSTPRAPGLALGPAERRPNGQPAPAAGAEPSEGRPTSPERAVLLTVALGTMLAPLNSTMIVVALPGVMADLAASPADASWLVTAYLIAMASLQPLAGRLGDRFGRRPLILGGLALFGLASLAATLAPSLPLLILFRVLQALGGAVLIPNGDALVRELVPGTRRAGRYGLIGAATAIAATAGPPLGGLIAATVGWRAIFLVNLALIGPALVLGWRVVPTLPGRSRAAAFDLLGALLLAGLLVATALLLGSGRIGLPGEALGPAALVLLVVAVWFVRRELRHPAPIFQPRLFARRSFAGASAAIALSNLAMYSTLLALPVLLAGLGWASLEVGLLLGVFAAGMVVVAPVGGRLADRFGRRWPPVIGLSLFSLALASLALEGSLAGPALAVGLAAAGLGLGLAMPGLQTAAIESVGLADAGLASGVYSTSRYFGSIVGSSLLVALLAGPAGHSQIFLMIAAAALLSVLAATALHTRPRE